MEIFFNYPKALLLLLTFGLMLALFIRFFACMQKNSKQHTVYNLYLLSLLVWILANAYFQSSLLTTFRQEVAINMAIIANISCGLAITFAFYLSCILHPTMNHLLRNSMLVLLIGANLFLNLMPSLTIIGIEIQNVGQFTLLHGIGTPVFFAMGVSTIIWTLINFISASRTTVAIHKTKMLYMTTGVCVFLSSIIIFSILIPIIYADYSMVWIPSIFSITEAVLFGYALINKRFPSIAATINRVVTYGLTSSVYLVALLAINSFLVNQHNIFKLSVLVAFILLLRLTWEKLFNAWQVIANYVVYFSKQNDLEKIKNAIEIFKLDIEKGLQQLAISLKVPQVKLIMSDSSDFNFHNDMTEFNDHKILFGVRPR